MHLSDDPVYCQSLTLLSLNKVTAQSCPRFEHAALLMELALHALVEEGTCNQEACRPQMGVPRHMPVMWHMSEKSYGASWARKRGIGACASAAKIFLLPPPAQTGPVLQTTHNPPLHHPHCHLTAPVSSLWSTNGGTEVSSYHAFASKQQNGHKAAPWWISQYVDGT